MKPVMHALHTLKPQLKTRIRTVLATLLAAAGLAAGTAVVAILGGWYDVAALGPHWQPVFSVIELAMRRSVRYHASGIAAPPRTGAMARRGLAVYRERCLVCHGAPGVAPDAAGLAMQPQPGPLVHMTQRWQANELYWIIQNGVKMSGMPAWRQHLSAGDMWALVAFIEQLPGLSPRDYAALAAATPPSSALPALEPPHFQLPYTHMPASAERGKLALAQYGCQSCHVIPGITGSQVDVGPRLDSLPGQRYIAGRLPNDAASLAHWLRHPQQVKPGSAMPDLGVSARDADDMAAYLLSQP
ncbi:c-type cytochrome [Oxalobacteraceae bacterium A2-2]